MITKDNKSLYASLFEKASEALNLDDPIQNIDEYFLRLGDIAQVAQLKNMYELLILPLDEPMFKINANTRNILVPDSFKNGVSVKGDEIAETLYFSIDRYFDTTDFFDNTLEAVVQWKNANGDEGISATTERVIIEDQSENSVKVIFGWPLSSEITKKDGNVQFSVRFYQVNADKQLEYSFSTLNATVKINASLDLDLVNGGFEHIDKNQAIYDRLRNSIPSNIDFRAISPIVEYLIPGEKESVDLDENNELIFKFKQTYPSGTIASRIGKQHFVVMRIDPLGNEEVHAEGEINLAVEDGKAIIDSDVFGIDYILTKDTDFNTTDLYFIKTESGSYIPYVDQDWKSGLYEPVFTIKVTEAGKYYVIINNELSTNNYAQIKSGAFEIAMPQIPVIGDRDSVYNGILENLGEEAGEPMYDSYLAQLEVLNPENKINYQWLSSNTLDENPVIIDGATENSYEVKEPGYYYLKVTNERNNAPASATSEPIRVTYPASEPKIQFQFHGIDVEEEDLKQNGWAVGAKLVANAYTEDGRDDGIFTYQWFRKSETGTLHPIGGEDNYTFSENQVGQTYLCKATNHYNNNKSTAITSDENIVEFTIVNY